MDFNERELFKKFQLDNINTFKKYLQDYDASVAASMRAAGYKLKNQSSRTVLFTFGEVTITRNRWYKNGKCKIPVDEKLGLKPYERISSELLYQIIYLSTLLPYRKIEEVFELLLQSLVSKDTVQKAVKLATKILKEKADYKKIKEESSIQKIKAPKIYLEGDGVMLKTTDRNNDFHSTDFSHFVVHTGSYKESSKRTCLKNKKEFISQHNSKAREQVLDYLFNHFEIADQTVLICNSDGGRGYSQQLFQEIGKALGIKKIEYFLDAYHVNDRIKRLFSRFSNELTEKAFEALKNHSRKKLEILFDTAESLLENQDEIDEFKNQKKKFLRQFPFMKSPKLRNIDVDSIGIMESQHRKITYRMKNRGMYWSRTGAETMSKLIICNAENNLRNLILGDWRKDYEKINIHHGSADQWVRNTKRKGFWRPEIELKNTNIRNRVRSIKKY